MVMTHRLHVTAELTPDPRDGGYVVYCPEFDIASQGDDPDEAITNLKEALRGYIAVVGIKQALREYRHPIRETIEVLVK